MRRSLYTAQIQLIQFLNNTILYTFLVIILSMSSCGVEGGGVAIISKWMVVMVRSRVQEAQSAQLAGLLWLGEVAEAGGRLGWVPAGASLRRMQNLLAM
jgi:hypothetical protein